MGAGRDTYVTFAVLIVKEIKDLENSQELICFSTVA